MLVAGLLRQLHKLRIGGLLTPLMLLALPVLVIPPGPAGEDASESRQASTVTVLQLDGGRSDDIRPVVQLIGCSRRACTVKLSRLETGMVAAGVSPVILGYNLNFGPQYVAVAASAYASGRCLQATYSSKSRGVKSVQVVRC